MTPLEYKLMGLLSRQPMSGYDLTRILKQRFTPFGSISHTQIYPALASLEKQGIVRFQIVEQQSGRPNKKVYDLTDEGRAALQEWVESPTPLTIQKDEFFLKAYSLWLANPERMIERFREQANLHQEQLEHYQQALQSQRVASHAGPDDVNVDELSAGLYRYVIGYEQNYLAWCQDMLQYLQERNHIQDGAE